jgi:hypothetical protein
MRKDSTYKELMALDQDVKRQMQYSPAFVAFNRDKINHFAERNKVRLKILEENINSLMETHVNKDEKGVFKQIVAPSGMPNRWDFKSNEDAAMFKKDLETFLAIQIEIFI